MKKKIIYAVNKNIGSFIQAIRLLDYLKDKFIIKIAANNLFGKYQLFEWNLDSLENFRTKTEALVFNDNFHKLSKDIKSFNPDLIITEFEPYVSCIAINLSIPFWHVSPTLLTYAVDRSTKLETGLFSKHPNIIGKNELNKSWLRNILNNANKKIIYSHFCDLYGKPAIKDDFIWARPYFNLAHNTKQDKLAFISHFNNDLIYYAQKHHIPLVNYDNYHVGNGHTLLSSGETSILADAFYNQQKSLIFPDFNDKESVINGLYSEHFNLGQIGYNNFKEKDSSFQIQLNNKVKFFHEILLKEIG